MAATTSQASDPSLVWHGRGGDDRAMTLFGLDALLKEMAAEGVAAARVLEGTGVGEDLFANPHALISRRQRLDIYRNAQRLARLPEVGLLAGARQRISDFGIYGYALASSQTLGAAVDLSLMHLEHAGPVLPVSSSIEGGVGILRSHDPSLVGELLPFVTEFWRASIHSLLSAVLGAPFPSVRMLVPYAAPAHWRAHERMFQCPVEFDAGAMEWHYDANARERELPNANPMTAQVCRDLVERVFADRAETADLVPAIRALLVNQPGRFEKVEVIAERFAMSPRTLHRRLAAEGASYQAIVDDVRKRLALQYLDQTTLTIEQVAERVGFSDASNFRKAFKKWTGQAPGERRLAGKGLQNMQ